MVLSVLGTVMLLIDGLGSFAGVCPHGLLGTGFLIGVRLNSPCLFVFRHENVLLKYYA